MSRILVLDDERDAGILIQRALKGKGHEVFAFTDEGEAIAFAQRTDLHLAILDIRLKRMSGIEVLEKLKMINPAIRAMILTGFPTAETSKRAIELGADDYCVKPIDVDELERRVAAILGASSNDKGSEISRSLESR